ncbi:polyprenyl synthetase family protein [Glaciecola petra]|uniref:Polyprenyl synthetase family protein n=1 Tax=Glaciecola petra TaxID=3075602 RepID=A0ABU2ZRH8_9ALTE|nr:polyprenyl synthetase family protein [Aestuariibacter sp. P117]MDT0594199.1 polyprenyl synthetase family protein [Aestuariibacter sp. P117]
MTSLIDSSNAKLSKQSLYNDSSYDELSNDIACSIDSGCYQKMEKKAIHYFSELLSLAKNDDCLAQLTCIYEQWLKENNQNKSSLKLSLIEQQMQQNASTNSLTFLQKLAVDKQLKTYLDKSLSYIFMRDLGKSLKNRDVIKQVDELSTHIQKWVRKNEGHDAPELLNNAYIDKKSKQYNVEASITWLKSKLFLLEQQLPASLDKTNGLRKLVKVIAGVVMHRLTEMPKDLPKRAQSESLDNAIRLGYCYGLTYPLIDDIQDSPNFLNNEEKESFNLAIRESLLSGELAEFPVFSDANNETMCFVYEELKCAFETIKSYQSRSSAISFFEQAFVFFEAQDIDRRKSAKHGVYSDEALFLPVILKSAGSRLVARDIVHNKRDEQFEHRVFCFGIYNQFNDDIKDLLVDIQQDNLTPYSHYYHVEGAKSENVNPYRVYWCVVFYLITTVYKNDAHAKQLLLERSINAHKSLKNEVGDEKYKELERTLLNTGYMPFDKLISTLIKTPNQVAWFDKLISREVSNYFEHQQRIKKDFQKNYQNAQSFIEQHLKIEAHQRIDDTLLRDAANYSLTIGGKRLRPVLAYITMIHRYKFEQDQTLPVLQLLEYMHTSSLVFDDKPSQDNASLRRGKASLHKYCKSEAHAELTGVYLIMKAVEVQTTIKGVDPSTILASIEYASNTTQAICEGQLLDLKSSRSCTGITELERICFLKTSLAIEAAMIIPAILANEDDIEKEYLKRFAKYLGLVFQLKDDLLDAEGVEQTMGKPVQQDSSANKASFVTVLGVEGARDKLYQYRRKAAESLRSLSGDNTFYEQLLDFVIHRQS